MQICALERKEHMSQVRALCVQAEKIEKKEPVPCRHSPAACSSSSVLARVVNLKNFC